MEFETIDIKKNVCAGLFFVLEREYNNSLKSEQRYYYVARSCIRDDPRLTNDLVEIRDENVNITQIVNTGVDYEIVKLNTLFYIISNKTDVQGWQYTLIEKDEDGKDDDLWSSKCISKNLRQRLWVMQISYPLERDEVACDQCSYTLSESFTTSLIYSIESAELFQDSILDTKKSGRVEVYYQYITMTFQNDEKSCLRFKFSNHSTIKYLNELIQISDKNYSIIISTCDNLVSKRCLFSLVHYLINLHKLNDNMIMTTSLLNMTPTVYAILPILYSDILCKDKRRGYKAYQLLLYFDRIELFESNNLLQVHTLFGGKVIDREKMSFDLIFDDSKNEQITIGLKCLNFKAKHVWRESIINQIKIQDKIASLELKECHELRASDVWGAIDENYQENLWEIIKIQRANCLIEAERDLMDLVDIQRQDTTNSSEFQFTREASRIANINCCCIIN